MTRRTLAAPVGADEGIPVDPESPRPVRRLAHTDAWPTLNVHRTNPRLQSQTSRAQVRSAVGERDTQRLAEPAGSPSEIAVTLPTNRGGLHPRDDLSCTQENRACNTLRPADDVQARVKAMTAVDVGEAGRPEHRRIPRPRTAVRVAGRIVGPGICLHFHDSHSHQVVAYDGPEQQVGHLRRGVDEIGEEVIHATSVTTRDLARSGSGVIRREIR